MNRNDRLQGTLVRKLITTRFNAPTIDGVFLSSWGTGTLFLLVFGVIVGIVIPIAWEPLGPVPMLFAGICLGAVPRHLGIAIQSTRFWPIQQDLLDWPKIEALAQGMTGVEGESNTA